MRSSIHYNAAKVFVNKFTREFSFEKKEKEGEHTGPPLQKEAIFSNIPRPTGL
jgi:hypothetical protein